MNTPLINGSVGRMDIWLVNPIPDSHRAQFFRLVYCLGSCFILLSVTKGCGQFLTKRFLTDLLNTIHTTIPEPQYTSHPAQQDARLVKTKKLCTEEKLLDILLRRLK